jgi:single-strand DNA-binding protein
MFHETTLVGWLGAKPETFEFDDSERSVTNFRVAVNERYKDSNGERQTITTWYQCKAWNGRGKTIAQYFEKGNMIIVVGRMRFDSKEDEHGGPNRIYPYLLVDDFKFGVNNKNNDSNGVSVTETSSASQQPQAVQTAEADDIPF